MTGLRSMLSNKFPSSCAGLRAAFKSPAREGQDVWRRQFLSSKSQDEGTGSVGIRSGAREVCSPICLSISATSCESVMKAMIRIGSLTFSSLRESPWWISSQDLYMVEKQ